MVEALDFRLVLFEVAFARPAEHESGKPRACLAQLFKQCAILRIEAAAQRRQVVSRRIKDAG